MSDLQENLTESDGAYQSDDQPSSQVEQSPSPYVFRNTNIPQPSIMVVGASKSVPLSKESIIQTIPLNPASPAWPILLPKLHLSGKPISRKKWDYSGTEKIFKNIFTKPLLYNILKIKD